MRIQSTNRQSDGNTHSDQQLAALGVRISICVEYPASAAQQDAADDHHRHQQATTRWFLLHGSMECRNLVYAVLGSGRMIFRFAFAVSILGWLDFGFVPIGSVGIVTLGTNLYRFAVVVSLLAKGRAVGNLQDLRFVATWRKGRLILIITRNRSCVL